MNNLSTMQHYLLTFAIQKFTYNKICYIKLILSNKKYRSYPYHFLAKKWTTFSDNL